MSARVPLLARVCSGRHSRALLAREMNRGVLAGGARCRQERPKACLASVLASGRFDVVHIGFAAAVRRCFSLTSDHFRARAAGQKALNPIDSGGPMPLYMVVEHFRMGTRCPCRRFKEPRRLARAPTYTCRLGRLSRCFRSWKRPSVSPDSGCDWTDLVGSGSSIVTAGAARANPPE